MSGVFLVVLGAVVLVVGLWATDQWLSGAPSDRGRGHPLLVVLSGATFMVVGIGLFSTPGREWTPPTRGDEIMGRARRAHEEAHRDAARRARRAAWRSRLPRWLSRRASGE